MRLSTIVVKDMARRKRRVLHSVLGVSIGITTVIAMLTVANAGETVLRSELERYGPNLTVVPATARLDVELGGLTMGSVTVGETMIDESVLPLIQQVADDAIRADMGISDPGPIAIVAPRLYLPGDVDGRTVTMVGVLPAEEKAIRVWWGFTDGGYMSSHDSLVAGAIAARSLGLSADSTVRISGSEYRVSGILSDSGSNDDYLLFVPLQTLQEASGKEGLVSTVDVRALCTGCPVEMIARALSADIPGIHAVAVRQVAEAELGMWHGMRTIVLVLASVTLLVGLFGVMNSMSAMVMERRKDIGIMRAVGASRRQIVSMFLYEALALGLLGGAAGYAAGLLLALGVGPLMLDGVGITPVFEYVPLAVGLAAGISMIAALHPALGAAAMKVADAVRTSS
ncbi:MAG: FtsX-like permease family protein [Dehalococcoidia bacterium]|jgi:putative ABC transport system permease protein|nr:FtsX-like permease family protein [Dehalococcoidia bacterium]